MAVVVPNAECPQSHRAEWHRENSKSPPHILTIFGGTHPKTECTTQSHAAEYARNHSECDAPNRGDAEGKAPNAIHGGGEIFIWNSFAPGAIFLYNGCRFGT